MMRHAGRALILVAAAALFCGKASGLTPDGTNSPYQAILVRNVFGLRPAPTAPPPEVKTPDAPKITPTGITTILGNKRALFKVQHPARPPEPAKEQSYILAEGQREGQIEVVAIDEKTGSIKFNNYGKEITLTLEKDGAKVPSTPPTAAPPPGSIPPPAIPNPNPAVNYGIQPAPAAGIPQPTPMQPSAAPGINTGLKTIPTRSLRLQNAPGVEPPPPPQ